MRRLMTAARWRDANAYYYGIGWRGAVAVSIAYLVGRML